MRITVSHRLKEKLERAKNLLCHQAPHASEEEVLERALDALVIQLEKRKYGVTETPHESSRESKSVRHVPARIRRAVHERDQDRCTFVAPNGRRCEARGGLEFDHIEPVARGGQSTVSNLRLRCRAHNQYEAEQAYGAEFLKYKIEQAREERARGSLRAPV
jgi:5-methylcytosine-specific restriction endonuclease McrA